MMKKAMLLILAALCLLLTGCTSRDPLAEMASAQPDAAIPAPAADERLMGRDTATLWFRYGAEPLLAPEERIIATSPTRTFEQSLLTALIGGPASSELSGLFPQGTQVLGTWQQGRMLFVTLSKEILSDYADEPDLWTLDAFWQRESPLRRTLAMQSVAATVTQNCDVDTVVILVEGQEQFTDSLRLRRSYYRAGGGDALADPLTRDESLLLSPATAMDVILTCWQERDWARLYLYTARTDPDSGAPIPAYDDFAGEMNRLPHLTDYRFSGGHVSGGQATLTASLTCLHDGHLTPPSSAVFRLTYENGVWRVGMSQLTARKEVQP